VRSQIPKPIKIDVLRKWLHGPSKTNAKEEGIGTVSSTIEEYKQNDTEFADLLRQVAVKPRSQGYSIESFAPLVRIRELLPDKATTGITIARRQEYNDDLKAQQVREESELEEKLEFVLYALKHSIAM
jgi:hypothetical protein